MIPPVFILLFFPLTVNIAAFYLSFLDWYERELKGNTALVYSTIISIIIVGGIFFLGEYISSDLLTIYKVLVTTAFFMFFPEIYLFIAWSRKGANKAFVLLSVAAYTSLLWLLLPLGYSLLPSLSVQTIIIATYISGVILGTLFPIAVIKEIRLKDGFITASAATTALSISDAVSKYIYDFSIFQNIWIQWGIIIGSAVLSWFLYRRATD
ncbi:MAG: hypothetical protein ACP6IP_02410 [Candidatus Njordarchaeia archaeon]